MKALEHTIVDILLLCASIVVPYFMSKYRDKVSEELAVVSQMHLNITEHQCNTHNKEILILNRTPKSGSQSLQEVIKVRTDFEKKDLFFEKNYLLKDVECILTSLI